MKRKEVAEELHLNENDLTSWFEKKLGHLKPYTTQILMGLGLIFAIGLGAAYMVNARQAAYADQWRELNLALTDHRLSGNTQRLMNVAEDYPNQKAGMWSLQIAGDFDLQTGISQLSYDREGGFTVIKRAKTNLQKVVDASSSIKSTELQRRSLFSLAYACESLGEFDIAKAHYQKLVDEAPDSAFAGPARRGAARCNNVDMVALYDKFKAWEDISEDAPGPNVPKSPKIDFPEVDGDPVEQPNSGGGDLEFGKEEMPETTIDGGATETVAEESADSGSAEPSGDTETTSSEASPSEPEGGSADEEGDDG